MAAAAPRQHLPDEEEFKKMSLVDIGVRFKAHRQYCIDWCREFGLLARSMDCNNPQCFAQGEPCEEGVRTRDKDKVCWRCPICKKVTSIRKGSFFEESHLELWQILAITYEWASSVGSGRGMSQRNLQKEACVSNKTVVQWRQYCRDIPVEYFLHNQEMIGGPGVVVEIDESLFSRRKNNVGRYREPIWVLGGYEQNSQKGFLVRVDNDRTAATLLPIIQQWVAPRSIIWTDRWAAYNQLQNLPQGYHHDTVNHSLHFVDPATGVCTNRVEAMWSRAKDKFKAMRGPTNRDGIDDYLWEYMWGQRFGGDQAFYQFWLQIARDGYPV